MNNVTLKNETTSITGYFYQVEQLIFLWVLFTFIVIGNGTVLTALSLSKGRKSRMNFFIKHLAFADLCVGLISVLTDIIWKITITWEAGLVMCKIIRFLQAVVTYSSTYVLVALSIDRYDAITHPMNFTGSWRRAKGLILAAWILSAAFSSPILKFFTTTETKEYGTQCWIDFTEKWQWQLYMTLVSISLFIIPAIIIGGCYLVIVCTIWSKSKEMQGPSQSNKKGGRKELFNGMNDEHESRRASSRGLIPKAKVKTVKMTFVIIFVFILCWSPYFMFDLLQVFEYIPDNETNKAIATFIQSLAPLNSAANPLIYCFFSTNVGHYICNRICRKKSSGSSTQDTQTSEKLANTSSLAAANAANETKKTIRERTVVNARNGVTVWTGPAVQTATIESSR